MPCRKSKGGVGSRGGFWSAHEKAWANILHKEIFEDGSYFKSVQVKPIKDTVTRSSRSLSDEDEGFEDSTNTPPYVKMVQISSESYLQQLTE